MSHVPSHYQPLGVLRGALHEGAFRRPYDGYYNRSERPQSYWNTETRVYDLRSKNKFNGRSGTPFPDQSRAYQGSQWNTYNSFQPIAGQIQQSVASGNAPSTSKKRRLSTVPDDEPFIDIISNRVESHGGQPKRKKVSNGQPRATRLISSSPKSKPVPRKSPISNQPVAVRIESIFRNVELLAQSYWDTGNALKQQSGMRAGVVLNDTRIRTV